MYCGSELEMVLSSRHASIHDAFHAEPEAVSGLETLHPPYQCGVFTLIAIDFMFTTSFK